MSKTVIIEDQSHAEKQKGEFHSIQHAFEELQRRATIPWDDIPNMCPCTSWQTCGREYEIIEYDTSVKPWKELRRLGTMEISAKGVVWSGDFKNAVLEEGV
jgi:hypothetical protein